MSCTIEHSRTHGVGEQRGPHRSQLASVAVAEIADLLLAECLADRVHVSGRVVRAHVGEQLALLCFAGRSEILCQVDQRLTFLVRFGGDVARAEVPVVLVVLDAVDRSSAHARASRVPRHDVETFDQRIHQEPADTRGDQTRWHARPAVVHHEHADAIVDGGDVAGDPQLDRLTLRIAVVDRHGDPATVDTGAQILELDRVVERNGRGRGHLRSIGCRRSSHGGGRFRVGGRHGRRDSGTSGGRWSGLLARTGTGREHECRCEH